MAASNCEGFSCTEEKSSIILDIMTHLVISKKLDPLADGTIEMVLSKVVELKIHIISRYYNARCKWTPARTSEDIHESM